MKNDNWKGYIPNILTMINMTLGIITIFLLLHPCQLKNKLTCVLLIIAGAIIDALDGTIARKLNAETNMGKQLDSFADLITFGLAPIALLHSVGLTHSLAVTILGWIYPIAGAFRLARYNLGDFTDYFIGLPITAAGIILTIYCGMFLLWEEMFLFLNQPELITAGLLGILSVLMVSRFKINRFSV